MGSACHCPVIIFKWQFESWGGGGDACEQVRDLCQRIALKNGIRDQLQGKLYPGNF